MLNILPVSVFSLSSLCCHLSHPYSKRHPILRRIKIVRIYFYSLTSAVFLCRFVVVVAVVVLLFSPFLRTSIALSLFLFLDSLTHSFSYMFFSSAACLAAYSLDSASIIMIFATHNRNVILYSDAQLCLCRGPEIEYTATVDGWFVVHVFVLYARCAASTT